ncbi:MAG TPA: protein translocase subunit SecF [Acidimicrobiales bacterium]|nr:protein translocase subunit SecF [Acidimicrobiales bacterium]
MTATLDAPARHGLAGRLYNGETAFDFVGHRRRWMALSGAIILIGLLALGVRGLNFGIDFRGGTSWEVPAHGVSVSATRDAVAATGVKDATVQTLKGTNGTDLRVEAKVPPADQAKVTAALAKVTHTDDNAVAVNSVGPTWGHEITHKAEVALVLFFIAVFAFISIRFQAKMAFAAIVAVIHDILVTVGIYAVFGFDVTPNTVIALLTILGYSLYDTVVVFDKVDENTRGLAASGRMTYSDTVNLSMNQVLMRSINTSLVAILPILSVLVIGDVFLGATTLKEFGLALFVGLLTGAYSSIFIAAPILAVLKEREPRYATIRQRLESRGAAGALLTPRAAAEQSAASGSGTSRARAATALLAAEDDGEGRAVLRPGQARDDADEADDEGQAPAPRSPARAGPASRPAANRPRPSVQRPPPRGRKKGGRRR